MPTLHVKLIRRGEALFALDFLPAGIPAEGMAGRADVPYVGFVVYKAKQPAATFL